MKIYRIKVSDGIYVKGVTFGATKDEEPFKMIPTIFDDEAGWYEEDKAKIYCEKLNENKEYQKADLKFTLEFVKEAEDKWRQIF